jgi:hypothetical protein
MVLIIKTENQSAFVRQKKGNEWLVGYNRWKETTCIVGIGNEAFHGERYYCLCTTYMLQPLR